MVPPALHDLTLPLPEIMVEPLPPQPVFGSFFGLLRAPLSAVPSVLVLLLLLAEGASQLPSACGPWCSSRWCA